MGYKFKKEYKNCIFDNIPQSLFANEIGISRYHLNKVINENKECSKSLAILITMMANKETNGNYDVYQLFEKN